MPAASAMPVPPEEGNRWGEARQRHRKPDGGEEAGNAQRKNGTSRGFSRLGDKKFVHIP